LGKGASADLVAPEVYAGSLVISINDAERIAPADICIFHEAWVVPALKENGYKSRLYITSVENFSPAGRQVLNVPYVPLTQESSELLMQRFMGDGFVIEDLLFLTAIKISKIIADIKKRTQAVYLVGFDFDSSVGYSRSIDKDFAPRVEGGRSVRICIQEHYFISALYFLRHGRLLVNHVGDKVFSSITAKELNGSARVLSSEGAQNRVAVVAELTTNHFGDRLRLERMIRASKAGGADFIKLQKRDVENFYTKEQLASAYISPFGRTFADYRHALELSKDDFEFVDGLCRELGIRWFASVLDEASFRFMQDIGLEMLKLPSTISEHRDYLSYVAKNYTGSIVLSTGMTDATYEEFIITTFDKCDSLYLLQCNSAYPTPPEDCNIAVVRHYYDLSRQDSRIVPGYSSHDFGWKASVLAVAAGARMVEKHVKLGKTEWAHFDAVAVDLTTPEFKEYVDHIREAEMLLGSGLKAVNASEQHKYLKRR